MSESFKCFFSPKIETAWFVKPKHISNYKHDIACVDYKSSKTFVILKSSFHTNFEHCSGFGMMSFTYISCFSLLLLSDWKSAGAAAGQRQAAGKSERQGKVSADWLQ